MIFNYILVLDSIFIEPHKTLSDLKRYSSISTQVMPHDKPKEMMTQILKEHNII